MGLDDIRGGLALGLATIPKLSESAYLRSNPTPPCAEIEPGEIEYDLAHSRGWDRYRLTLRVLVGVATDEGAQRTLDRFLEPAGEYSVKAAVEADKSLDGAADDVIVRSCSGYRIYAREGAPAYLGAEWQIDVYA